MTWKIEDVDRPATKEHRERFIKECRKQFATYKDEQKRQLAKAEKIFRQLIRRIRDEKYELARKDFFALEGQLEMYLPYEMYETLEAWKQDKLYPSLFGHGRADASGRDIFPPQKKRGKR